MGSRGKIKCVDTVSSISRCKWYFVSVSARWVTYFQMLVKRAHVRLVCDPFETIWRKWLLFHCYFHALFVWWAFWTASALPLFTLFQLNSLEFYRSNLFFVFCFLVMILPQQCNSLSPLRAGWFVLFCRFVVRMICYSMNNFNWLSLNPFDCNFAVVVVVRLTKLWTFERNSRWNYIKYRGSNTSNEQKNQKNLRIMKLKKKQKHKASC